MADDSIDELCRAFAQLSLHDKPVGYVAQRSDGTSTTGRNLFQAILSLMDHNDHLSHDRTQFDSEGDTIMGIPTPGKFPCF